MFDQAHQAARNQYDKLGELSVKLQRSQDELSQLLGLGELLEPDDVIKTSARLVAHQVEPHVVASWLADMPQVGGEPLVGWVQQHLQQLSQAQQALVPLREQARHQLGLVALASLSADHVGGPEFMNSTRPGMTRLPGSGPPAPAANPLTSPSVSMPPAPQGNNLLH